MFCNLISRYSLLFIFIPALLLLTGCGSSSKLLKKDLNHLQLDVTKYEPDAEADHYLLTLSGFTDRESDEYLASLHRLNVYPDDVIEVSETEMRSSPAILAHIKDHPLSLNRVLWQLGREHYRAHSVDHRPDMAHGGYVIISSMPEMIGSFDDLQATVRYPSELKGSGVEGEVRVRFIINEFGEAEDPEIIQSLHDSADREALRVVNRLEFSPGIMDGVPVRVQYTLPVFFRDR